MTRMRHGQWPVGIYWNKLIRMLCACVWMELNDWWQSHDMLAHPGSRWCQARQLLQMSVVCLAVLFCLSYVTVFVICDKICHKMWQSQTTCICVIYFASAFLDGSWHVFGCVIDITCPVLGCVISIICHVVLYYFLGTCQRHIKLPCGVI